MGKIAESSWLECISCAARQPLTELRFTCAQCGSLLDVRHEFPALTAAAWRARFDQRLSCLEPPYHSGVWRYKELIWPEIAAERIVSGPEGNTNIYEMPALARLAGVARLAFKHEGENPTGSFKDRGMSGALTHALFVGATRLACASTGNTAASLACYGARAGLPCLILVDSEGVPQSKQAQILDFGAVVLYVDADFDGNMKLARNLAEQGHIYLANSLNPLRLEGQKTIIFELMQQLRWRPPDWIIVPGGNLGNVSAFGKALMELRALGILSEMPRLAVIQASGANPFYRSFREGLTSLLPVQARTLASAIRIGNPINFPKAARSLRDTDGVVEEVRDAEILDARALLGRHGIGCEPASAATLAGLLKLRESGVIGARDTVACILTGHGLKDIQTPLAYHRGALPDVDGRYRNQPVPVAGNLPAILDALAGLQANRGAR